MKQSFLAIAIMFLLTQGVFSQVILEGMYFKSDEEQIAFIDKMKQEIKNNVNSYTKTEKVKDSTGYRYVYTKGNDLQLVTVYYKNINNIDKSVEWYFHNGQLFYSEKVWTNRTTEKVVENEKFYLNNEQLFAWFQDGKWKDVTSPAFKKMADDLAAYAAKLKEDSLK